MSAEATKTKPAVEGPPPRRTRVVGIRLKEPVPFNGTESTWVKVVPGITITAVRLDENCDPVPVLANQRVDGLMLERDYLGNFAKPQRERIFVSMASGPIIQYGE